MMVPRMVPRHFSVEKQMPRQPPKSRRGAYGTGGRKTAAGSYPQYWHAPPSGACQTHKIFLFCADLEAANEGAYVGTSNGLMVCARIFYMYVLCIYA